MKQLITILATCLVVCTAGKPVKTKLEPVKFSEITVDDEFWTPRLLKHKDVTVKVCIDQIENQTGRIRNFENAAKGTGKHSGIYFDDSDVYKALEGMAYTLRNYPDSALGAKCEEWIAKFAAAQEDDGYINTYYSLTGLDKRWSQMGKHEMYCAGHMMEAAVAYYNVTGKKDLLTVCEKMAEHMMSTFGPGKRHWVPGHEEIELALMKLYETTGKKKYLEFAHWLLEERGHGYGSDGEGKKWNPEYFQDAVPVSELSEITGHAVRLMYLLCGMSDVAAHTGDKAYMEALERVWEDVVLRNMYITGGIGSSKHNEGFTTDYDLPNKEAYCETCASVGMVLWNWRMNRLTGDSKYVDVMEKALYNGALAGISLEGDRFFYVNPLESDGNHHRKEWYGCACCPSQICRFLPSIGNYIYGTSKKALWVNLFIGNKSKYMDISTEYPWSGNVTMTVKKEGAKMKEIRIRIPQWCKKWSFRINGRREWALEENGYAVIERNWKEGDIIDLKLDMEIKVNQADPQVKADAGKRAITRGPLVYCLEEVDNPSIATAVIGPQTSFKYTKSRDLGGIVKIESEKLHFIPYYAWDNRRAGKMKVWVDYR